MTAKWYVFVRPRRRAQTIFVMLRNCSCAANISVTSPIWRYVVLAMIASLLLLQCCLCAVKEKLDNFADGLIGDGPRDKSAPLAGAEGGPQGLCHPRLALCAPLCTLYLVLGPLDEVKHQRLHGGTIAQPDAAEGVEDKAAQHQHCRHRGGDDAQNVIDRCHVLLSSLFFVVCFEVCNAVVCHFDLFFKYRDALGKVVVHSHLPGQLFQLCVRDRLLLVQLGVHALGGVVVGDDRADQAQTAGDNGYDDCFAHAPSRRRVRPFFLMIRG
nr:MAG TPA: hypothetical protein [Caudoviricetes sp.]